MPLRRPQSTRETRLQELELDAVMAELFDEIERWRDAATRLEREVEALRRERAGMPVRPQLRSSVPAPSVEEEPEEEEDGSVIRGLSWAVPFSLLFWALVAYLVYRLVAG